MSNEKLQVNTYREGKSDDFKVKVWNTGNINMNWTIKEIYIIEHAQCGDVNQTQVYLMYQKEGVKNVCVSVNSYIFYKI